MTLVKVAFLMTIFFVSVAGFAKPSDSDLVVPSSSAQSDLVVPNSKADAEQDAIHAHQLNNEEISDDIAQKREPPPREKVHATIVPYTKDEDDGASESAAGNLSAKTSSPPLKPKPTYHYAGLHVGPYYPGNLQGQTPGITYANVYGSSPVALIQFDYEKDFIRTMGKLGVKGGLGFFTAQGDGRFVNNPELQSDENLMLVCLPFTVAPVYHFEYWDRQLFIPYAEAGLDYFGIFEIRSDATTISQAKFGGGAAAHYAAGLQIQLDFLDREGLFNMGKEYGIQHLYLTLGIRQFFALSSIFDFSAVMYEGGFSFEF